MPEPSQPGSFPDWATNGGTTQVAPSGGMVATGWTPTKPPYQIFNWLLALLGTWTRFFQAKNAILPGASAATAIAPDGNGTITPTLGNHTVSGTVKGVNVTNLNSGRILVLWGTGTILHNQAFGGTVPFLLSGAMYQLQGLTLTTSRAIAFRYDGTSMIEIWRSELPSNVMTLPGSLLETTLTVNSSTNPGFIFPTRGSHAVEVSSGISDTLNGILSTSYSGDLGGVGFIPTMLLIHTATAGHTITVKNNYLGGGASTIGTADGLDAVLDAPGKYILLQYNNSTSAWVEVFRNFSLGFPNGGVSLAAGGTFAPYARNHTVDTFGGAASQNLVNAVPSSLTEGQLMTLSLANAAHVVTVVHLNGGSGQFSMVDGANATLTAGAMITFRLNSGNWFEVSRNFGRLGQDTYGATSASSATTYTATPVPAFNSYFTGMRVSFFGVLANTGACTLNVNGLGAKNIKVYANGLLVNPWAGYLAAGAAVECVYDGTQFIVLSAGGAQPQVQVFSPSAAASLAITGLVAGGYYKVDYALVWNTSSGNFNLRFNNDSGANYKYAQNFQGTLGSTAGTAGSTAATAVTTNTTAIAAGTGLVGSFVFSAKPGTLTSAILSGQQFFDSFNGALTNYAGQYAGGANVTELDLLASAGTFTGTVTVTRIN